MPSAVANAMTSEVAGYSLYVIDPRKLLDPAMSSDRIRGAYDVRETRTDVREHPGWIRGFRHALEATKFKPFRTRADFRYGLSLTDETGKEVLWICMTPGAHANVAVINGRTYVTSGELGAWFAAAGKRALSWP